MLLHPKHMLVPPSPLQFQSSLWAAPSCTTVCSLANNRMGSSPPWVKSTPVYSKLVAPRNNCFKAAPTTLAMPPTICLVNLLLCTSMHIQAFSWHKATLPNSAKLQYIACTFLLGSGHNTVPGVTSSVYRMMDQGCSGLLGLASWLFLIKALKLQHSSNR